MKKKQSNFTFALSALRYKPVARSSVRKENQTKDLRKEYNVSTRIEHVQTKSIDYYSPLSPHRFPCPFPTSFDCCITPISTPIILCIERFLLILSTAIFTTVKMTLVQTIVISAIIARARTWDNQRPWPAKYATYLQTPRPCRKKDTKVERVGYDQGRLGRQRSPRLRPLWCRRCYDVAPNDCWEAILKMTGGWWSLTHIEICMCCQTFDRLFDGWSYSGPGEMMDK